MVDEKEVIRAFEEEHELLESEKEALKQLYAEIKEDKQILDDEVFSVKGFIKIVERIERREDFLAKEVKKKIEDPKGLHSSDATIKDELYELKKDVDLVKNIHDRMSEMKISEIRDAENLAEANWEVLDILRHAVERAEKTISEVKEVFKE